jgi:hypothetical protein
MHASDALKLCVKPLPFPFPRTARYLTVQVQLCPLQNKQQLPLSNLKSQQ